MAANQRAHDHQLDSLHAIYPNGGYAIYKDGELLEVIEDQKEIPGFLAYADGNAMPRTSVFRIR